ncbi:hypothetical protein GQ457_15G015290 [Hibiscus cannabinus]
MDMIFYHINLLIIKIREACMLMDHRFQVDKREEFSYIYNIDKRKVFDTLGDIHIHNYLGEDDILNAIGKFSYSKLFLLAISSSFLS